MSSVYRHRRSGLAAILLSILAVLLFAGSALAAPLDRIDGTALESFLMRERIANSEQSTRLNAADSVIDATRDWINQLKTEGKDTAALESALATYQEQVNAAKVDHDSAASILASPAGFDASGAMTDARTALQTVVSAGRALRQAHLTLTQSTINFRAAIQAWMDANN